MLELPGLCVKKNIKLPQAGRMYMCYFKPTVSYGHLTQGGGLKGINVLVERKTQHSGS